MQCLRFCVFMCVCEKEWRVRGYLQTETNQCVWDKKAAFMVYGNHPPSLPPPCIITTTYSHDWWNMRLWNLSCFCYHPVFPSPPSFLFSQSFFCLVQPLCLSKYLSPALQRPKMFGTMYKQEIKPTARGPSWNYAHAHIVILYILFSHMRHAKCMRKATSSEEEYEERE